MSDQQSNNHEPHYEHASKQPQQSAAGKGLGIAAMIIGIVAAVLSFIPGINILGMPLAGIGLVLGIIALILSRGGRAPKGYAVAGAVLSAIALVITIVMWTSAAAVMANDPDVQQAVTDAIEEIEQSAEDITN